MWLNNKEQISRRANISLVGVARRSRGIQRTLLTLDDLSCILSCLCTNLNTSFSSSGGRYFQPSTDSGPGICTRRAPSAPFHHLLCVAMLGIIVWKVFLGHSDPWNLDSLVRSERINDCASTGLCVCIRSSPEPTIEQPLFTEPALWSVRYVRDLLLRVRLIPVLPSAPARSPCTQLQVAKAYIPLEPCKQLL